MTVGFVRALVPASLVLGMAVGLGAQDAPEVSTSATVAPCLRLTVVSTPATINRNAIKHFSARGINSLNFAVVLAAGSTPETIALKLFTPNGHLYQQVDVPVAPEGSRETERKLEGYQLPVKVARARLETSSEGALLAVALPAVPVPGTSITANSLYGTWRAEAWSLGSSASCSVSFELRQ